MKTEVTSERASNQLDASVARSLPFVLAWALLIAVCVLHAAPRAHSAQTLLSSLDAPGFNWDEMHSMDFAGVPVHIRPFDSRDSARTTAEALAGHTRLFQRVLTVKDKVVLSGLDTDWHWLAEVNTSSAGSAGYVSVMRIVAADGHSVEAHPRHETGWLPVSAQRRFSQRTNVNKKTLTQQLYSTAQSVEELTSYLRRKLRNGGWKIEQDLAAVPGAMVWQRRRVRLTLIPIEEPHGSSLLVQYME